MKIKCGKCKSYHDTVAQVRLCYQRDMEEQRQAEAELAAEKRNEQWWEERGGAEDDPIEREKWAMEDDVKAEYAKREQEQEEQAYLFKMKRDEELAAAAALDKLTGEPSGFNPDPPSDRQISYALDLLTKKEWPQQFDEADLRNMARRQVSKLISGLTDAPWKPVVVTKGEEVPAPGMYWARGVHPQDRDIVRVYHGQKSGRELVKRIIVKPNDKYGYEYVGTAERLAAGLTKLGKVKLSPMTKEEAKEWGRLTGCCVVCGRRLDVPESVEAGIGPVCQSRGWGVAS